MNQFTDENIERMLRVIGNKKSLRPTVSLCHSCHAHIPAFRYELEDKIYLVKNCVIHGASSHLIEVDAEFYHNLKKHYPDNYYSGSSLIIEATDRCNLDCPHCYHLPDNSLLDKSRKTLLDPLKSLPIGKGKIERIELAGAEATIRKDFAELCAEICDLRSGIDVGVLTNGLKLNDKKWFQNAINNGLACVAVALHHPSYHNHATIRQKQENGIENALELGCELGYISYTMIDLDELDYILHEIVNSPWDPNTYRIRLGSDIGRNASEDPMKVSIIYKAVRDWCDKNNKSFDDIKIADNNIYHIMVEVEGKRLRLIQWCDETNIDMEELRSGPYSNFVPDDGISNFLHQIIRRDTVINKKIALPDKTPLRYQWIGDLREIKDDLDLYNLEC